MPEFHQAEAIEKVLGALGILVNTCSIYDSEHPVFIRLLDERFSDINEGLSKAGSVKLRFQNGKIVCNGLTLEPSAGMVEKISRRLAGKGMHGFLLKKGLHKNELKKFIELLKTFAELKNNAELGDVVKQQAFRHIKTLTKEDDSDVKTGGPASSYRSDDKTFELDLEEDESFSLDSVAMGRGEDWSSIKTAGVKAAFRGFVGNVLDKVQAKKISGKDAAKEITEEFDSQLTNQINEYKAETESRIRRLENIKDLVLDELASLDIAAIVIDPQLNVIAMNRMGRKLLGKIRKLEAKTPLALFCRSSRDKQKIVINGQKLMAHLVISETPSKSEGAMLICLD